MSMYVQNVTIAPGLPYVTIATVVARYLAYRLITVTAPRVVASHLEVTMRCSLLWNTWKCIVIVKYGIVSP